MINIFTLPLITFFLLLLQAIFAGAEISLLSCDKATIKARSEEGLDSAKLVMKSIDKIEEYVGTSLVGENLCIIINTVLVSTFIEKTYTEYDPHLLSVLILTPLIVVFGQVVPKSIFQNKSNFFVLKTIYFSHFFRILFRPFLFLIEFLTNFIVKIIGTESKLITREELIHEIEIEASLEDSSQKFRDNILNRILLFDKIKVKDIMISIDDIASINIKSKVSEAKDIIKLTGFSRLPVYDFKKDLIKGTIHSFHLLGQHNNDDIMGSIDPPFYVNEEYPVSQLLDEMKNSKSNMAIVGSTNKAIGIVTLEDILEEILGDIQDEHD